MLISDGRVRPEELTDVPWHGTDADALVLAEFVGRNRPAFVEVRGRFFLSWSDPTSSDGVNAARAEALRGLAKAQ